MRYAGGGGSLQDVRHGENQELSRHRKTSSACNLRRPSISGECIGGHWTSLMSDTADLTIQEENTRSETTPPQPSTPSDPPIIVHKSSRSSSFNVGAESSGHQQTEPLPSVLPHHRRLGSWSQAGHTSNTPPSTMHRRQQSLVSGQSSKSTSAYSTLSERSGTSMEGGDADAMSASLRGRLTLIATSSRVEETRVDPQAVINNLFSGHTFDGNETERGGGGGGGGGLKIYVDKKSGTVTVAGPNLDRYVWKIVDIPIL